MKQHFTTIMQKCVNVTTVTNYCSLKYLEVTESLKRMQYACTIMFHVCIEILPYCSRVCYVLIGGQLVRTSSLLRLVESLYVLCFEWWRACMFKFFTNQKRVCIVDPVAGKINAVVLQISSRTRKCLAIYIDKINHQVGNFLLFTMVYLVNLQVLSNFHNPRNYKAKPQFLPKIFLTLRSQNLEIWIRYGKSDDSIVNNANLPIGQNRSKSMFKDFFCFYFK